MRINFKLVNIRFNKEKKYHYELFNIILKFFKEGIFDDLCFI